MVEERFLCLVKDSGLKILFPGVVGVCGRKWQSQSPWSSGEGWMWLLRRDSRSGVIHMPFLCDVQPGKQRWEMQRVLRFLRAWEEQPTLCFPRAWKCFYFTEELWFELALLISMGFYHTSGVYLDSSLDMFHLGLIFLPLKQPLDSDRWPPTLEAQQKYESSLTLELRVNLLDWPHLPPGHCSYD